MNDFGGGDARLMASVLGEHGSILFLVEPGPFYFLHHHTTPQRERPGAEPL